ncbi:polysaccharide biosynthesis/export family protein [uncultured Sphingomonas sp.]|uniref:polysaccharide biosynthesis/export family protein n=1 Tax=uncultured Sphingomonas sp. TaxID=158754 RepID=UPI002636F02D|nr:polysaccharide biosynthesis/export family protein [uncultured Sphingomonas sp.]
MSISRSLLIGVLLLTNVSCASGPPLRGSERLTVLNDTSLPKPVRADLSAPDRTNLIGPLDTLSIEVFGVEDLTREVKVDSSGRIAFPMIGEMEVAGKTSSELAAAIRSKITSFVRAPQVIVNLREAVSQVVTVDGEVRKPGLYPVTNQMTLLRAVASAEGTTEFARLDNVIILRRVDGKQYAGLYSVAAIRRGVYDDPYVYANDVVVVGESPARRLFKDVLAIAPLMVGPVIALIQRN